MYVCCKEHTSCGLKIYATVMSYVLICIEIKLCTVAKHINICAVVTRISIKVMCLAQIQITVEDM